MALSALRFVLLCLGLPLWLLNFGLLRFQLGHACQSHCTYSWAICAVILLWLGFFQLNPAVLLGQGYCPLILVALLIPSFAAFFLANVLNRALYPEVFLVVGAPVILLLWGRGCKVCRGTILEHKGPR